MPVTDEMRQDEKNARVKWEAMRNAVNVHKEELERLVELEKQAWYAYEAARIRIRRNS